MRRPRSSPCGHTCPLFSPPSTCQSSVAKNMRWIAALSAPKPPSLQVKPRVLPVAHRARSSAHPFTCLLPPPGSSLTHGHPGCSDKPGTVAPQGICRVCRAVPSAWNLVPQVSTSFAPRPPEIFSVDQHTLQSFQKGPGPVWTQSFSRGSEGSGLAPHASLVAFAFLRQDP